MSGTTSTHGEDDTFSGEELRAIQSRLARLAHETTAYPLECSLGTYAFLFESRDDIKIILDNLNEEIREAA